MIFPEEIYWPFLNTVYLSAIANISGILWEIKIKDLPSLFSFLKIENRCSTSSVDRAVVGSSKIKSFASL